MRQRAPIGQIYYLLRRTPTFHTVCTQNRKLGHTMEVNTVYVRSNRRTNIHQEVKLGGFAAMGRWDRKK